jgi:hypothetical protein
MKQNSLEQRRHYVSTTFRILYCVDGVNSIMKVGSANCTNMSKNRTPNLMLRTSRSDYSRALSPAKIGDLIQGIAIKIDSIPAGIMALK